MEYQLELLAIRRLLFGRSRVDIYSSRLSLHYSTMEFSDNEEFESLSAKICVTCGRVFTESYIRQQHEAVCVYSLNKRRHDPDKMYKSVERVREKYLAIKMENEKLRPIIIPPKKRKRMN